MVGSVDSLEDYIQPSTVDEESSVFPLECWQNFCLSDIWIPSQLLHPSNNTPNLTNKGVFHKLEKEDVAKCIKRFSLYSDFDAENELFESDSDENFLSDYETNSERTKIDNRQLSEDILSAVSSTSPLSKTCESIEKDIESHDLHEDVIVSQDSLNLEAKCTNSFSLNNIYENVEKSNECNDLNNSLNTRNSFKATATIRPNSNNNAVIHDSNNNAGESFNLLEDVNEIEDKHTEFNIVKNAAKINVPLIQNIFVSCDKLCNSKELNSEEHEQNICIDKSVNEILNTSQEISMKDFSCSLKNDFVDFTDTSVKKTTSDLKRINKKERKMRKKASKYIPLDKFLDDEFYEGNCYEENTFDEFYHHIMSQQNASGIPLQSNTEFPDLISKGPKFVKSNKSDAKEDPEIKLKSLIDIINESSETAASSGVTEQEVTPFIADHEVTFGKIVIENIPQDVSEDDICTILFGYGEIKKFSLVPAGKFLKAHIEMDLVCDIDWIIECLNGSEPFGASGETLKCYKKL